MTALRLDLDQRTLTARAKRLATRPDESTEVRAATEPLLVFRLAAERFCLRMNAVISVVPLVNLTTVPAADPRITGVMVVKGEVHAVFDLNRVLGLPRASGVGADAGSAGYVLVLRLPTVHLGVHVDQVEAIDHADLRADAASSVDVTSGRRLVTLQSGRTMILIEDFERLLAPFIQGDAP